MKIYDGGLNLLFIFILFRLFSYSFIVLLSPIPDHISDAFYPPFIKSETNSNTNIFSILKHFMRWDSIYFTFVSTHGYVIDTSTAFFPFLPILINIFRTFIVGPLNFMNLDVLNSTILSGILVNFIINVLAIIQLYRLTIAIFKCERLAILTCLLFMCNPALVFFLSLYSESIFFLTTISGLLYYEMKSYSWSFIALMLSGFARSNGVLNVVFFIHPIFVQSILEIRKSFCNTKTIKDSLIFWKKVIFFLGKIAISIFLFFTPFIIYQIYIYSLFCDGELMSKVPINLLPSIHSESLSYFSRENFNLALNLNKNSNQTVPLWCKERLPSAYNYMQKEVWGNGFLKYFQIKQIPNFLLAVPIFLTSVFASSSFYKKEPKSYLSLGIKHFNKNLNSRFVIHIYHLLFLTMFALTHMHVQVMTRMILSSCPIVYWFIALRLYKQTTILNIFVEDPNDRKSRHEKDLNSDRTKRDREIEKNLPYSILYAINPFEYRRTVDICLLGYFLTYSFIGCILHSNGFPWT